MTRPVLFLDIDGVLNSALYFAAQPAGHDIVDVDPRAVRRVQRIVAQTGAMVVLSSTWRKSSELRRILQERGVPFDDTTPIITGPNGGTYASRGEEIATWLAMHPEVETFAILDDDADAGDAGPEHFVRTYWRQGMYGKHENAVLRLLGAPYTARMGSDDYDSASANGWYVVRDTPEGVEALAGPFVDNGVASRRLRTLATAVCRG